MNTPGSKAAPLAPPSGERALIDRIRRRLPPPTTPLLVGIGDDAAVVAPERGALQVLTIDAVVEGVHFDRRFGTLSDAGYRALAVNVSDVAAMGGAARLALVSFLLPEGIGADDVDALVDGIGEMAREAGVTIAGGNVCRTPGPLAVDITVVGSVRPRRVLKREGGRPGQAIYVTGAIGASAAGLDWLRQQDSGPTELPVDAHLADCVGRYRRPIVRHRVGMLLGRTRTASACMDASDGLGDALHQLAEACGTGVRIDASLVPVHPGAASWFGQNGRDPLVESMGSDDYEIVFALAPRSGGRLRSVASAARGVPITRIGELTREPDVVMVRNGQSEAIPAGFTHF